MRQRTRAPPAGPAQNGLHRTESDPSDIGYLPTKLRNVYVASYEPAVKTNVKLVHGATLGLNMPDPFNITNTLTAGLLSSSVAALMKIDTSEQTRL